MGALDVHQQTLAKYLTWMVENDEGTAFSNQTIPVPVVTWQGANYACNYSLIQHRDLSAGGYIPMDDLIVEVLEPMPVPGPVSEQLIIFQDKVYRIRQVQTAAGKHQKLICYDPSRGA